jgi:uncharacterized protein (DUF1330 family)
MSQNPLWLVIQGQIAPGEEGTYEEYLEGTRPLMEDYDVDVIAVGAGVAEEFTSDEWGNNAILQFPDRDAAVSFFSDPRYRELEPLREKAYEDLRLSAFEAPPTGQ